MEAKLGERVKTIELELQEQLGFSSTATSFFSQALSQILEVCFFFSYSLEISNLFFIICELIIGSP
jgi:hypothetical protein